MTSSRVAVPAVLLTYFAHEGVEALPVLVAVEQ